MSKSVGLSQVHSYGNEMVETEQLIPEKQFIETDKNNGITAATHIVLKLVHPSKGDVFIPCDEIAINDNGIPERMRVLKGVPTIWSSEQAKMTSLNEKMISKLTRILQFHDNICRVEVEDVTMQEFIKRTFCNQGSNTKTKSNKFLFYVYDAAKQSAEALKAEDFELEMVIKAKETPVADMEKHASYLGVHFIDPDTGFKKGEAALRRDYMRKAKQNPKRFSDTYDSPIVTVAWLVKKALTESKIDLSRVAGCAYLNNGMFICKVNSDIGAIESIIEYAMLPTAESKQFLEKLKEMDRQ